ncbi:diaminopimelate epimerase [Thiofaba sp. EF100]|uniref:diaminopimelate epimerase n=1 Tax=Thiofaba sp. EF100 TaxID=3121274 RepID=UPI003221779D
MQLSFVKMHGLGNDFVVLDGVRQPIRLTTEQVRFLADRHFGIGCDQLLLVEPAPSPDTLFRYRIFNADGGEVEQCGNGARCFARFVRDEGLTDATTIPVMTASGRIVLHVEDNGEVTVDMGVPRLEPAEIPFEAPARAMSYPLAVHGEMHVISAVSMGNPHAVLRVEDVDSAPVETLGPAIESHPRFPKRVNVGFMQVLAPDHIRLRVYERGAGETLACGTGACAAVVAGRLHGWLVDTVKVDLPGGRLTIHWQGEGRHVLMTGPATRVFEGRITL